MRHFSHLIVLALTALALLSGCKGKNTSREKLLPNVSGKAGEVIVVIDKESWEGAPGAALREYLSCDCPYLSQREPMFSLANVPHGNFNNMFKVHRNIVLMDINPQASEEKVTWLKNEWARPQSVVRISAFDRDGAVRLIGEEGRNISEFFEQAERDRIIANAKLYENAALRPVVEELTGGILHFPTGYKLKARRPGFVWIADEKQYTNQAVLIYKYPVPEGRTDLFSMESVISKRNEVMKENVPGQFDNTYMTTSLAIEPTVKSLRYKGRDFLETRGFWEVYNDFMGGPFVSHSFYSPDGKEIIVLEAFVYAPKYDKRQYLRQVESILYSFEWVDAKNDKEKS